MDELVRALEQLVRAGEAQIPGDCCQTCRDSSGRLLRVRILLPESEVAGIVDNREVGERATDVDSDAKAHVDSLAVGRPDASVEDGVEVVTVAVAHGVLAPGGGGGDGRCDEWSLDRAEFGAEALGFLLVDDGV